MTQTAVVTAEELLSRAEELVPILRERGPEAERLGQLPDTTIADFAAAGFLDAMRPKEVGGHEIDISTFAGIMRTLARGDASSGWIGGFLMCHAWMLTKFGAEAQDEIFAGRASIAAAAASAPPGRAERVTGGFKVSGRWRFASGIMHSEWVLLLAVSEEYGPLSVVVPVDSVTIHKTWHVPGMKATGSNDVEVVDLFVPAHRALGFAEAAAPDAPGVGLFDYPLLKYPMHRILPLVHPVIALGTADAALELFREHIGSRVRPQTGGLLLDEKTLQQTYAEAYQRVNVASLVLDSALDLIEAVHGPGATAPTMEQRANLNLAFTYAGVTAFEAVDILVRASGASIHRTGHPLDRVTRDTQVMRNHGMLDWQYVSSVAGGALLGRGLGDHVEALF